MKIYLFLLSCLVYNLSFGNRQLPMHDSTVVVVRTMNLNSYKQDKTFNYKVEEAAAENYWDRFWRWFWGFVAKLFSTAVGNGIFNIVLWTFIIAALAFFIWKVSGMNGTGMFRKDDDAALAYSLGEENIHAVDFNTAIENAVGKHNYRLATRLLYLQTLKLLTDKNLIDWKINKTNAAYVAELVKHPRQNEFAQLTGFFDKAWYGESHIEAEQFNGLRQSFHQFQQQL